MSVSLEQLISEYLDHELDAEKSAQVEVMLRENVQAKKVYDDFVTLRRSIRSLPESPLPSQFQADLFQKIAANSKTTVAKTSAAETAKVRTKISWQKRWTNPRIWAYPLVAVLVAVVFLVSNRTNHDPKDSLTTNIQETSEAETVDSPFIPPMPEGTHLPRTEKDEPLSADSTVEIFCQFSKEAMKQKYMQRLLAEKDIPSVTKTSGLSKDVIYEMELSPVQLVTLLDAMHADKASVLELRVPSSILTLFDRSALADASPEEPDSSFLIKIRFIVSESP